MAVLKGTAGANKLIGTNLADTISGLAGNDTLIGNAGNDTLLGGDGNDILQGGAGNDTLKGEKGNDTLKGDAGADKMFGGAGNDKYYVDSTGDRVNEGIFKDKADSIYTTISINAASAAFGAGQIEQVRLLGTGKINATGNSLNNTLVGNSAANILKGGSGDDHLMGGGGNDVLYAGAGKDRLDGGAGKDRLDGGAGNDLLVAIDGNLVTASGGGGIDTLQFTGSNLNIDFGIVGSLGLGARADMAAVSDSVNASGIEIVNIKGAGANQINLNQGTLQAISGGAPFTIIADADDTVTLGFSLNQGDVTIIGAPEVLLDGPVLDANILDGFIGFRLDGAAAADLAGRSVSSAGDVDGDGFDDLLVGAFLADPNGNYSGSAYLVFGTAGGFASTNDLSALGGVAGYRFDGASLKDYAGFSLSSAGDVNGDGFADLIFGAYGLDGGGTNAGGAYVVFGGLANLAALDAKNSNDGIIDFSDLDGASGFRIDGAATLDDTGRSVSSAGDVNGDGFDDLIVGALDFGDEGAAYVVFGKASAFPASIATGTLDPGVFLRFDGHEAFSQTGLSVSEAGDVNGDGIGDLLISAHRAGGTIGAAHLVFGGGANLATLDAKDGVGDGAIDLSQLDGKTGYRFDGFDNFDLAGYSLSSAGDINGDGFDDLIISAIFADPGGIPYGGIVYVVFGGTANLQALDLKDLSTDGIIDLSELDGTTGFRLDGTLKNDIVGGSVSSAGDINADGFDDLIIGAPNVSTGGAFSGAAYVLFGGASGFASSIDLSTLDGNGGFRLDGVIGDELGYSVSSAGDIDGDGFNDLIVGAYQSDAGGAASGAAYVIYGNDFRLEATKIGTSGADTITGTSAADILVAAQGNDTINGGGGADAINGGSGNDQVHVADKNFFRIDGGGGLDTLFLDYSGAINFGYIDGNPFDSDRNRITGIEIIDVTNGHDNNLVLHKADLLDMDCQVVDAGGLGFDNMLLINGELGDELNLFDTDGWSGPVLVGGYNIYTSGNVRVAIDVDIEDVLGPGPVTAFDLAALDGASGYRLDGATTLDLLGRSARSAGDVNGDGIDDLIIGAEGADFGATTSGAAYVLFGGAANLATLDGKSGTDGIIDLSDLDGSTGFRLDGAAAGDVAGISVASAGDVNSDGFDDLIVGASKANLLTGAAYVVYGTDTFSATLDLGSLTGATGSILTGALADDNTGRSVASIGDFNGDGIDDVIVGGHLAGIFNIGAAYVLFGNAAGLGTTIDLGTLDGTNGFRLDGSVTGDYAGFAVSGAGDVNGDGFGDLIVGAKYADPGGLADAGLTYVIFGGDVHAPIENLESVAAIKGFRIVGAAAGDQSGRFVAAAGDINGDGFDDVIVGGPDPNFTGAAYVVFGSGAGFASNILLSTLDGANGFRLEGVSHADQTGFSVGSAGDINGDGFDDLVIGANNADAGDTNSGAAYVLFGAAAGFASVIDLSSLSGDTGFRIEGVATGDDTGVSVSSAGDIDGDGFDDLLIGADTASPDLLPVAGSGYVVRGGDFRIETTEIGTAGADGIEGTATAEILVGAQGDDIIDGAGGADAINGGAGNDAIHVADNAFFRLDGGGGLDVLHLDYSGIIDFGNIDGNALTSDRGRIAGIEVIDVNNGLVNALTLHKADVLDIDCQVIDVGGVAGLDNVLKIDSNAGGEGDSLQLFIADGWVDPPDILSLAGYAIYTSGNVRIAVDTDIAVTVS